MQEPISNEDFKLIPKIIYNYDSIQFGETDSKNTPLIKYAKNFSNSIFIMLKK